MSSAYSRKVKHWAVSTNPCWCCRPNSHVPGSSDSRTIGGKPHSTSPKRQLCNARRSGNRVEARRGRAGAGSSSGWKRGGSRCERAGYRNVRGQTQGDRALSTRCKACVSQSQYQSALSVSTEAKTDLRRDRTCPFRKHPHKRSDQTRPSASLIPPNTASSIFLDLICWKFFLYHKHPPTLPPTSIPQSQSCQENQSSFSPVSPGRSRVVWGCL